MPRLDETSLLGADILHRSSDVPLDLGAASVMSEEQIDDAYRGDSWSRWPNASTISIKTIAIYLELRLPELYAPAIVIYDCDRKMFDGTLRYFVDAIRRFRHNTKVINS